MSLSSLRLRPLPLSRCQEETWLISRPLSLLWSGALFLQMLLAEFCLVGLLCQQTTKSSSSWDWMTIKSHSSPYRQGRLRTLYCLDSDALIFLLGDEHSVSSVSTTTISKLICLCSGYGNWTANGWNVRIHGSAYRNPPATADQLDAASQAFVPSLDESGFTDANRAMARNVTAALITLPVQNYSLQFTLNYDGKPATNITFPYPTDDRGEFDQFIPFTAPGVIPNGNETKVVQGLEIFTPGYASECYVLLFRTEITSLSQSWQCIFIPGSAAGNHLDCRHRRYLTRYKDLPTR
jgi:hypothetical protein